MANRTLTLADAGAPVGINDSEAVTVAVPAGVFPVPTTIQIDQLGAGAVTLVASQGVTLNGTLTTPGQFGFLILHQTGADSWIVVPSAAPPGTYVQTFDARKYGLTVVDGNTSGVGTDNTAAVNAAVVAANAAGGGIVDVPYIGTGNVLITGLSTGVCLVLKSNVRLRLAPGVKLRRKSGTTGNFIVNDAVAPVATAADGAISSSVTPTVLTTSLASQAVIGQTVIIGDRQATPHNGAGLGGSLLVANIIAVTATTVTLDRSASSTTTAATVTLFNRTKNFGIDFGPGSSIECGAGGGTGITQHHVLLRHFDGFTTTGKAILNSTGGKFCLAPGDGTDVVIPWIGGSVASTVLQFDGPMKGIDIGMVVTTGTDDGIAFTASEGPTYYPYEDTEGPITDVEVGMILATTTTVALKLTSGAADGTHIDRFHCGAAYQFGSSGGAVSMAADTGNLDLRTVTIDRTYGSVSTQAGTITSLTIGHIEPNPNAGAGSRQVDITDTSITKLHVKSAYNNNPALQLHLVRLSGTATVSDAVVEGFFWSAAASSLIYSHGGASCVTTTLRIAKGHGVGPAGSGTLVSTASGGTMARCYVSDTLLESMAWIIDSASTTDLFLNGVTTSGTGAGGVTLRATGAVTVYGAGIVIAGANAAAAGGTLRTQAQDFPLDVGASYVTKTNGDRGYNTNAASAPVGPVICDGVAWRAFTTFLDSAARDAVLLQVFGEDVTHVLTRSRLVTHTGLAPTLGQLHLTYFTPSKSLTITKIGASSGSLASGATLIRFGLYTVGSDDGITALVAAIASDTTLFAANNTFYERALSSGGGLPTSYTLVAGTRYAIGYVIAGGSTPGAIYGVTGAIDQWSINGGRKTQGWYSSGLTDLPAGPIAVASIVKDPRGFLWEMAA